VPILREGQIDIISHSAEQTRRLGVRLGTLLGAGDVVCLSGDLGAGKTVFSAGVGKGWGASAPLTSPTFNLVHVHTRESDALRLYHLDCYRLQSALDADSIGIDDILPKQRLWVELRILEPTRRNLIIEAIGERYETLISKFRESTFGAT
jgi:tRNA threonylcarbamoyladenosine biosynthesis protein TsaE